MKPTLRILAGAVAALLLLGSAAMARTVVVGNFGDPTPMNAARAAGKFKEATGWDVEFRKFATGTDVIAAMASGDVVLSELGSSPLAIAASQGVNIEMFMFSFAIGKAESLIVRDGAGIESLADLRGRRVAVPVGSTAHFSLMGALDHAGIAESDLTIMNMPPDQIAAAWQQGAIDAAFVWQPVQSILLQTGTRLVGADQTAEWGYPTFNAWVVNRDFAKENRDALIAFAKVMNDANMAYANDPGAWTADSEQVAAVARETGAAPEQVPRILKGFTFIPLADQLGPKWLGSAAASIKATAEFLKQAGRIDKVAEDYSAFVDTGIAEAAAR